LIDQIYLLIRRIAEKKTKSGAHVRDTAHVVYTTAMPAAIRSLLRSPRALLFAGAAGLALLALLALVAGGIGPGRRSSTLRVDQVRAWISPTLTSATLEPATPLRLQIDIPDPDPNRTGPRPLPSVLLELRDAAGAPAVFGSGPAPPQAMFLRGLPPFWTADISAPTVPGSYHPRLTIGVRGEPTQTVDLAAPVLTVAVTAPPLQAGFVYDREGNLWLTAEDGARTRKLTFYRPPERALQPAWTPDGQRIAYVRGLPVAADQLPVFEIWSIRPDGGDDRPLVTRQPGEDFYYPTWTSDGQLLITVERVIDPRTGATPTADRLQNGRQTWELAQIDPATGARRILAQNALLGHMSGDGAHLVYLATPPGQSETELILPRLLTLSAADGSNPRPLLPEDQFQALHTPRLSPDGQWVAFAATNPGGWLPIAWFPALRPLLGANGVPWDIYLVATAGGPARRLTQVQADLPVVAWSRDSRRIAFITESGLYLTDIDGSAPRLLAPGAIHSYLSWHGP
jgi:Tol biopolymer transport system component